MYIMQNKHRKTDFKEFPSIAHNVLRSFVYSVYALFWN